MTDDRPMRLKDAAEEYGMTVSTLRAEHERGRLAIYRIGKSDYTKRSDMDAMVDLCLVEPKAPAFTVTRRAVNTSSETARASFACRHASFDMSRATLIHG